MNLFTQIVATFLSGGLGAGIVTFVLNSLKADRDFLRSKLETLYLAVHKYTEAATLINALILSGNREQLGELLEQNSGVPEYLDQMNVIIDLYFPQLRPSYDEFRKLLSKTNVQGGALNEYDLEYRQKFLRVCDEAEKFKKAIVQLSRSHTLLSWTY
jgi:hypothetical protein